MIHELTAGGRVSFEMLAIQGGEMMGLECCFDGIY
jgi:hypothetical protein